MYEQEDSFIEQEDLMTGYSSCTIVSAVSTRYS